MWSSDIKRLLGGDDPELERLVVCGGRRWLVTCSVAAVATCAAYGFTFGLWRSGEQAVFTAIKFPLVIGLTCLGNGLLNGLLGQVLGSGLSMRQSGVAILMSFSITGFVLASLAPVMLFLLWNTPSVGDPDGAIGQNIILLAHVGAIAWAGCLGNLRLWHLLRYSAGDARRAGVVLISWLAVNLLLGSQISWMLRPWIGRHEVPITFFSAKPLEGNFFEAVWAAAAGLISKL